LKNDLNFWHSANPALNLITNINSPKKKGSMIGYIGGSPLDGSQQTSKDLINMSNEQFFVKRTSSKMGPRGP